ncbi:MAG: AsmA-like C-terminal region-containing protein [Myxococcota bacterium]
MRRSWMRLFWMAVVVVGIVAGYLVSSGVGTRLLHTEIETQLTRILQGPVEIGGVDVRWEEGLRVEARDLAAYPSPLEDAPPGLRARRIIAWVDLFALMVGRLELSTLVFEGPHVRLVQDVEGGWVGLPIQAPSSYPDEGLDDREPAELVFARLAELDGAAGRIADDFQAADRIVIVDGTLEWIGPPTAEGPPTTVRAELLNGIAERHWLSQDIAIDWRGVFLDGIHSPFNFTLGVHRAEGRHFVWSLGIEGIPLAAAEAPMGVFSGLAEIEGTLDTRFRLFTDTGGLHRLAVEGAIENATIELQRAGMLLEQDRFELEAEFEVDPVEIRLVRSRLEGGELGLEFQGAIRRPIRSLAPTRIEARTRGIDLDALRRYALSLADDSPTALTISRLTERVVAGRVKSIEVAGTAPLAEWQALASGELRDLPAGFVLGGAFDQVVVRSGPDDAIEDLEGEVEWVGDQIVFRNGRGSYRGSPLPELNAVINGLSAFAQTRPEEREIRRSPPPLPGLGPLSEILRPRDPDALPPFKVIGLALERLEHPIFRWPLEDLEVLIEPLRRGMELTVRKGRWGGAPVKGEVVWFNDPEAPSVSATLTLSPPEDPAPGKGAAPAAPGEGVELVDRHDTMPAGRWGQGRFEMEFRPRRWLPFERATGHVRFEETRIHLDDLDIEVEEQGTFAARMALDLDLDDSVGFDTSFALTGARLEEIGPFVALPEDLAKGSIESTGSVNGRVRPNTSFIAELEGRVRAEAHEGTVQTSLPLLFRIAKATEGYNPFANENRLAYETMDGTFTLDRGVISVEDFEIEGPLRVFARADIDTNPRPATIRSVVGIFLFRKPSALLDNLSLLRSFLPGSERGLFGTYFEVEGALNDPEVDAMPVQTLMSGVPDAIKAPFKALRFLFDGGDGDS